jgi:hypothetical protein
MLLQLAVQDIGQLTDINPRVYSSALELRLGPFGEFVSLRAVTGCRVDARLWTYRQIDVKADTMAGTDSRGRFSA